MTILANVLVIFFIAAGLLFLVVAAIGVLRLPDLYTRAHAASKSSTLGVMCILLGVFFHFWLNEDHINPTILLGVLFLFITGPVGAHIMSRSSYIAGVKPWSGTGRDDLKVEIERMKKEQNLK
ncbi:monovalent cation/H(+) antiporter subunit G [Ureibacillus sp. GCM10028918]|uniref:monovalent cation/H(+) antiporter subunit G n=1 Tax=Ureibacillus sp. GCM10028918 TaxID=3273429 RepID=UPI0036074B1F